MTFVAFEEKYQPSWSFRNQISTRLTLHIYLFLLHLKGMNLGGSLEV